MTCDETGWKFPKTVVLGAAVLGLATATLSATGNPAAAVALGGPEVRTAQGWVRGHARDGIEIFRAIPYAAPPVGALRFRDPRPARPWQGVFDATAPGPACPQAASADPAARPGTDEDCLRLNVFAPARPAGGRPVAGRPVLVWIHGGAFIEGFGGARQYYPARLVKQGDVIVVTINYRLGALGLLATRSLDEANAALSGNFALRDQEAALRWVRQNIAAFGGDPGNVTLFGHSAGSDSLLALLASPPAKGLFARAIVQSATANAHTSSRDAAEQAGERLAETLGCKAGPGQASCLRQLPVQAILAAGGNPGFTRDPRLLPLDPYEALREGRFNRVPLIIGSTRHEAYLFVSEAEDGQGHRLSAAEYARAMQQVFGPEAAAAMRLYPAASEPSPAAALGDAETDAGFSCYMDLARLAASRYVPVYGYEMGERDPVQQQPQRPYSLANTSYHTSELAYLFDFGTAGPLTGKAAVLGRRIRAYWLQFARTGSPDAPGLPDWPQFHARPGTLLDLAARGGTSTQFAAQHRCGALARAGLVTYERASK